MAIPKNHVITLAENHQMPYDPTVYKNMGTSPRYHVYCSCQWEGWTHSLRQAHVFVMNHQNAQIARGNTVELSIPPALANCTVAVAAGNQPELIQPSKVDDIAEAEKVIEIVEQETGATGEVVDGVPVINEAHDPALDAAESVKE